MKKKILIVDDSRLNIRLLKDILEDEDFEVFTADNGLPVLKMSHEIRPDIILLDIMMPGLDGYEVCKFIKRDNELKNIPVIMVTAKAEGADLKKAFENGAFDYIKKPIDEVELIARIQSALKFKEQQDMLVEIASRDGLTGLYTHAMLLELFEKEWAKQKRNAENISFIMLDVDFFKQVNDTYGHMCGDSILKELSNIIAASVRIGDIAGRYGGEEFGIVVSRSDEASVYSLCERIRIKIENHIFKVGDKYINITVSMGIFIKNPEDEITASKMVRKADEALYRAKHNGRNMVEVITGNCG